MKVAFTRKAAAIIAAVSTVFTSVAPYSVSAEETSAAIVAETEESVKASTQGFCVKRKADYEIGENKRRNSIALTEAMCYHVF